MKENSSMSMYSNSADVKKRITTVYPSTMAFCASIISFYPCLCSYIANKSGLKRY